jgi:hypothetical protein
MSLETVMLATLIIILGAAQYALCVQALRDLAQRPRVRGQNKVLWALWILCVPIAGAIVYNWMGPTSFMRRPVATSAGALPGEPDQDWDGATNVTSIAAARSRRRRRVPTAGQATRPQPPVRQPGSNPRPRRTGS